MQNCFSTINEFHVKSVVCAVDLKLFSSFAVFDIQSPGYYMTAVHLDKNLPLLMVFDIYFVNAYLINYVIFYLRSFAYCQMLLYDSGLEYTFKSGVIDRVNKITQIFKYCVEFRIPIQRLTGCRILRI